MLLTGLSQATVNKNENKIATGDPNTHFPENYQQSKPRGSRHHLLVDQSVQHTHHLYSLVLISVAGKSQCQNLILNSQPSSFLNIFPHQLRKGMLLTFYTKHAWP